MGLDARHLSRCRAGDYSLSGPDARELNGEKGLRPRSPA